jgi:glycosyltransferase involved in cell wall biosynthesis
MPVRISVIICAYNYGRFLRQCLQSVTQQTRPVDEIVVVDDGSQDNTTEIVRQFPEVRYLYQENSGKAAAFNRGFASASGDLICHLDADDYWLPNKIERILQVLGQGSAGGVMHDTFYVDGTGAFLYGSQDTTSEQLPICSSFRNVLLSCFIYKPWNSRFKTFGVGNTICVRRDAVSDFLPLPHGLGLAVDGALALGAARHGMAYLPEKLSAYRHHGSNFFVADLRSEQSQLYLFRWVGRLPGVEAEYDQDVLRALSVESGVHSALAADREPIKSAASAASLLPRLFQLGLIPQWKHFALPAACLLRWRKIRGALSAVSRAFRSA